MKQTGVKIFATLALLLVSLVLYGCSPSESPQTETNVLVLEPEAQLEPQAQVEAASESIEEPAPPGDEAPQAKLAFEDSPDDPAEAPAQGEPAQSEPGVGFGGGAPEAETFDQVIPSPTQESILVATATATAPAVEQTGSTGEPTVGSQAPEFNLQTLDGQSLQLSALRGKNILLSYWVTWCIPCMEELPALNRLYQEYQDKDVVILSVNGIKQDEMDKVMAALSELGISMPIAFDQDDGLWNSYWVRFLPTSFFINEDGIIRHIQLGSLNEDEIRSKLEQLISDQL